MSELNPYQVRMNGWVTTMLLSDEDAEMHRRLGHLDPEVEPEPVEPEPVEPEPVEPEPVEPEPVEPEPVEPEPVDEKVAAPRNNKARTAPSKG